MTRTVMDATDIKTGKKIYFNGHAQATFMADGSTVEDNINASKEKLNTLNLAATDIVSGDGLAYVLTSEFESKMNELGGLLDEINGLFDFYIDDESFQSPEQMTWGDWVESQYNEFGYKVSDIHGVTESDLIIQDNKYISQNV